MVKQINPLLSVLSIIFCSCIDVFDLTIASSDENLIVDGLITNEPGPHIIRLSKSLGYFEQINLVANVESGATLKILDSRGATEILTEIEPDMYSSSDNFHGEVGESYSLSIELKNGDKYLSEQEEMKPNNGIDKLIISPITKEIFNANNNIVQQNGVDIAITSLSDDLGGTQYYRWRYKATYQIRTSPELRTINEAPDPLPCSGFDVRNGSLAQTDFCTCCDCWVEELLHEVVVRQIQQSGNSFNQNIDFVADIDGKFSIRFFIEVQQLSLTQNAFSFWSLVASQQRQGSLFDFPSGAIDSNIKSISNKEEQVLGFFGVSAVSKKQMFISPSFFSWKPSVMRPVLNDCRTIKNSSNIKPLFW